MVYTTLPRPASSATTSVPRRPVASPAWRHVDVLLIAATAAISALGVLMVYSTTRTPLAVAGDNPQSTMKKQAVYAVVGLVAFVVTVFFDYKRYLSWAPVLYVGSLLLLMATLVVGRAELGATSWIQVGSIQVEPSEIVKVSLVLSLAALLANRKGAVSGRVLLAVLGLSVLPFLLIYKQDALGSAMVLAVVMVGMLLMAGTRGRHMVALALVAALAIGGRAAARGAQAVPEGPAHYFPYRAERSRQLRVPPAPTPMPPPSSTTSTSPRRPSPTAACGARACSKAWRPTFPMCPTSRRTSSSPRWRSSSVSPGRLCCWPCSCS